MSGNKSTIKQIIWRSFAESDERFLDLFRIGYALGILAFIVFSGYHLFNGGGFDPMNWGTGFGAILFGGGLGVGLRAKNEDGPQPPEPPRGD